MQCNNVVDIQFRLTMLYLPTYKKAETCIFSYNEKKRMDSVGIVSLVLFGKFVHVCLQLSMQRLFDFCIKFQ